MEISELEALRDAGTVHVFHGWFGRTPEGLRGRVESVGAPADPDVVIVRSVDGLTRRNWNRHTMSVA
ncbi:hypothetical protein F3K32_42760 [Streptomyces sp. LBUM 1483]|uniref:hypothetical protein n=1 Tax=Streptomyces scabiei TaxID=1930 RepID=UPI001B33237A|nr:hypothetical protein [Streptomyces sp. LBUM 1483]MBP5926731.1 hypothetical protein [Streptomyces sp. LBUM 1483]